ncbi:cell cycle checkpoint [Phanerochaete sordida]|uniref:Checkpoint protein n=1 Tax=Phanerochaete sordida TaxID=48140 RepID=A0A9P3L823_9APHY|nr:cell cycle checkpoint [Phanerochaete sordida]
MRFRTNVDNVAGFYRIVQALAQLQKKFVMKFTETAMFIVCSSDINEGGMQVWTNIKVSTLFVDYRIQSNANNEIGMTVSTEALLTTLRSACSPNSNNNSILTNTEVIMRLAKKNDRAVLSFEIIGQSRSSRDMRIVQDVRIEMMRQQELDKLREPMCPEPDIHIMLPPLTKLRTVMERLRSQSDIIRVQANKAGRLDFAVSTDSIAIEVCWTGLQAPTFGKRASQAQNQSQSESQGESQEEQEDEASQSAAKERMCGVLVNVKSIMKFLQSHVVCSSTIAGICQRHCLILYVYIGDAADAGGILTFYIPAIMDDDP